MSGSRGLPFSHTVQVVRLVETIRPLLAGHAPDVLGAALADLLAIWLAGHHVEGDTDATRALRDELLANHLLTVIKLVPVNAKIIGTTP